MAIRYVPGSPLESKPISNPDTSVQRESTKIPLTSGPRETIQDLPGQAWDTLQAAKAERELHPYSKRGQGIFEKPEDNPFYFGNWPKYGEAVTSVVDNALSTLSKSLQSINATPKGQR